MGLKQANFSRGIEFGIESRETECLWGSSWSQKEKQRQGVRRADGVLESILPPETG